MEKNKCQEDSTDKKEVKNGFEAMIFALLFQVYCAVF